MKATNGQMKATNGQATNGYKRQHGLTVKQENAIDLLVTGKTDGQVAEAVGLHRVTVTKWRLYDPWFQAELNRRRLDLWGVAAERLRALLPKALDVIERELDGPLPYAVALNVLKLTGLDKAGPPTGTTDPERDIIRPRVEARLNEKQAGMHPELRARRQERAAVEAEILAEIEKQLEDISGVSER
jgi:hypothetical protein